MHDLPREVGPSVGRASLPFLTLTAAAVAAVFAAPFAYLLVRNLTSPAEFWATVTDQRSIGPLFRTLTLALVVSITASIIGAGTAWLTARTDLPGLRAWRLLLPLPLVIPSFIAAMALIAAAGPGGLVARVLAPAGVQLPEVRGFVPAFILLTVLTYPYVYLPVAARLQQIPPSIEEVGRTLGHRPASVALRITLPEVKGAVLAGGLLVFLYVVSDFGAVQLLRYDTLTRSIYARRLFDQTTSLAQGLELGMLAAGVVILERRFSRGLTVTRGRSVSAMHLSLGRWKGPCLASVVCLLGLSLAAPIAVLSFWAFRGLAGGSGRAGAIIGGIGQLARPAVNTAGVSLAAAILTMLLVLPVAYLSVKRRSAVGSIANAVIVAGFALPGLAIALALVFWTLRSPGLVGAAYQTLPLLILGYLVHFGAHGLRAAQVAVAGIPEHLHDAAKVLRAGWWKRFARIELPLMFPGLAAGAGLVLLSTMKELPATLLLAPAGFQTLATKVWTAAEDAFIADASVAALLLVALSGVLTWLLIVRRAEAPP